MTSDRDRFLAALFTGPLIRGDAIVVLCGEDGAARAETAAELFRMGAAPKIVLTGGRDTPPRWLGAPTLAMVLVGRGISPDRIVQETESQNTAEQARALAAMAAREDWHTVLLVASPYHAPRAFLTFLRALSQAQRATLRLVPMPASQTLWTQPPPGASATRLEMLADEFEKIERYGADVASYADGLEYLAAWEAPREAQAAA